MLTGARVDWPSNMKMYFGWLSSMSFNVDLAAPECAMPSLSPEAKWGMQLLMPVVFGLGCLGGILVETVLYGIGSLMCGACMTRKGRKRHRRTLKEMKDSYISIFNAFMYLTYVQLVKRALQVFNCNLGNPPEIPARYFMEMMPDQECWSSKSVHLKLIPFSLVSFFAYGFGFPAFVFFKLYRNRRVVEYDQLLLALDTGNTKETNPHYGFRIKYHRLYYLFRPNRYYWVVVVLFRKIRFTSSLPPYCCLFVPFISCLCAPLPRLQKLSHALLLFMMQYHSGCSVLQRDPHLPDLCGSFCHVFSRHRTARF
jgi:hypothetical protein